MAGYGQDNQGFFQMSYDGQGYDMPSGNENMQFGQFDYNQGHVPGPYGPPLAQPAMYSGNIMTPQPQAQPYNPTLVDDYENEPPLMEELGINFDHICQKTVAVLNPLKEPQQVIMQDTDLAGPLVFCCAFGAALLLAGKVHFGYVYGIAVVGCIAMYALLNLMSMTGVSPSQIVSILGYCLLPMVLLSGIAVVISLKGLLGIVLTALTVIWCSISASKLFVYALAMDSQQLLVAYPCALLYGVFALLTVF